MSVCAAEAGVVNRAPAEWSSTMCLARPAPVLRVVVQPDSAQRRTCLIAAR